MMIPAIEPIVTALSTSKVKTACKASRSIIMKLQRV